MACLTRLKSKPSVKAILATTLWISQEDRVRARVRALEATVELDMHSMGMPVMRALGDKAQPKYTRVRALLDELLSGKPRKEASDEFRTHLAGLDAGPQSASAQHGQMRCKAPNSVGSGEVATLVCPGGAQGGLHVEVCRDESGSRCVVVYHGTRRASIDWEFPKSWGMDYAFLHVRLGQQEQWHLVEVSQLSHSTAP